MDQLKCRKRWKKSAVTILKALVIRNTVKKSHQNWTKNENDMSPENCILVFSPFAPFISKTVRDRKNKLPL